MKTNVEVTMPERVLLVEPSQSEGTCLNTPLLSERCSCLQHKLSPHPCNHRAYHSPSLLAIAALLMNSLHFVSIAPNFPRLVLKHAPNRTLQAQILCGPPRGLSG